MKWDAQNRALVPLLLVNFIGVMGFSIVLPFLVFLVDRFGGNAFIYGLLGATYPALQLVGAPVLGKWSDIYGRKKVLLLSQGGTMLSWMLFLTGLFLPATDLLSADGEIIGQFTLTLPLLVIFFARAFDGLTGGNISVANAYMGDLTDDSNRSRNFGLMAMSSNMGFIVGPALAAALGSTEYGESLPVFAALLISIAGVVVIVTMLPESHPNLNGEAAAGSAVLRATKQKVRLGDMRHIPHIPYLLLINFLIFLAFNLFYTAFPVHALKTLGWAVKDMGIFFGFIAGLMVLMQGPVLGRLGNRFSSAAIAIVGSFLLAFNFILMNSADSAIIYLGGTFFAVGNGVMWPSVLAMISKQAGPEMQGSVQGIAMGFGSLAAIIGLLTGGFLYENMAGNTFYFSAAIIYLVFLLLLRAPRILRSDAP